MNWNTHALGSHLQGLEGAKTPKIPLAEQWLTVFGGRCYRASVKTVWLEGEQQDALPTWLCCFTLKSHGASDHSHILWRVGRKKVMSRLLVSQLFLLHVKYTWQGWPGGTAACSSYPTPMASFRCTVLHACVSAFPLWVQSWAAEASRDSQAITGQGTVWFAQQVRMLVVYHV